LCSTQVIAQSITIDDSSRDASQPTTIGNSCTTVSNISISSSKSTAYFNNNTSAFPKKGVIIRNGIAKYRKNILEIIWVVNKQQWPILIMQSTGQNIPITDVAYLEFDFVLCLISLVLIFLPNDMVNSNVASMMYFIFTYWFRFKNNKQPSDNQEPKTRICKKY
jgi:hypothetical protein